MRHRVPQMRDVNAALDALKSYMQSILCLHPGTGAAFLAGWGQCLKYRLTLLNEEPGLALRTTQELMEQYSPKEVLDTMREILSRAAAEAAAGGNSSAAAALEHQCVVLEDAGDLLEDFPPFQE